ncbi:MFS transporter [soil metagenome]
MPSASSSRTTWLALLIAATFFMENLDGTVITTAVPDIARSFGIRPVDLDIGVSAYLLTLGIFIPVSGWVADRFGSRRVFASAIVLFTIASLLCGAADGLWEFVGLRALQGIGGALMVPVGRLVVLRSTPKDKLIDVIALLTWPALVAPVLGPPIGGWITTTLSWRWIFYLNLPLGIIALGFAWWLVPDERGSEPRRFDWTGFFLSGIGIASLLFACERLGGQEVDAVEVLVLAAIGMALLLLAFLHFRRSAHPMIDLHGFTVPTFAVTVTGGSMFRVAIGSLPFLLPLMFQVGFGLDAFHSGLLLVAVFAGNLMMKPGTGWVLRRFGFRQVLIWNGLINAASIAACALFTPATPIAAMVVVLFIGGLSRSMQFTALNTIAFADIAQPRMNGANTLFSTALQVSLGLGIAAGAISVRLGSALSGWIGIADEPAIAFRLAFVLIAGVALAGGLYSNRLASDAGSQLARRRPVRSAA